MPFVVIIGEDEMNSGVVAVKNMATGEQVTRPPELAALDIRAYLRGRAEERIIKDHK